MSLTVKFALFTSTLCIAIIAGIIYLAYLDDYDKLEESIGQRLEAIVRSAAIEIDGTAHDQIKGPEDAETPAFITIRDHLRLIKQANDLSQEMYTFRRIGEQLQFIVMTHEKPFIGDTYEIRKEMHPTLNDGKPARTGLYHDTHGAWISAYAPIFDQNGQISGLLEADVRVDEFEALLREQAVALFVKGLGFVVLAVICSFLLARTVTKKLNYLTHITEKISLGKMDTPIQVKGSDEVAKLGSSLERMRESLKIAAEMIE